ncbi:MAG TPA: acetyl-CoA carboxylase biotin carboxyl carrier protein [Polyangiaceae bacterium]|nr:acetyl-CoA carboxylase biotin carboxyl carrier protein [Polyangiaceae bacterium]HMR76664.1 acetyl-CoA carboxylase biotin carboxyl carrier protein [Polyangiaceae bacterium]
MEISLKQLRNLIATLEEGGVQEMEYEDEKLKLRLSFARAGGLPAQLALPPTPAPAAAATAPAPVKEEAAGVFVTSPFVGTFYLAPAPDAEPFVTVGATVKKGQVLCIVEAMKLMNEIEADHAGVIDEILVENAESVEFGQKLFRLR